MILTSPIAFVDFFPPLVNSDFNLHVFPSSMNCKSEKCCNIMLISLLSKYVVHT